MGRFEELGTALDLLFGKILNRNFNKADELIKKTEQELNAHKSSNQAHDAASITYKGKILGAENSEQAIDYVDNRLDTAIIGSGEGRDPELSDMKTTDPSYIPARPINVPGDITRDMQKQFSEQLAETTEQAMLPLMHETYGGSFVGFMVDDGHIRDYTVLKPIFEAEGVPCNICIITGWTDKSNHPDRLTSLQIKELHELGWGIESHTNSHANLSSLSESEIEHELVTSKTRLKQWIGVEPTTMVYPYGANNETVRRLTRKYYQCGIGTSVGSNQTPFRQFNMLRINGLGETDNNDNPITLSDIQNRITQAAAQNAVTIIKMHTSYAAWEDPQTVADLQTLIQWIKSEGIPIVTVREMLRLKGNIIDTGDYATNDYLQVSRDGKTKNPSMAMRCFVDLSVNNSTLISHFSRGETINAFSSSEASGRGFPTTNACELRTVRPEYTGNQDFTAYQELRQYQTHNVWRRYWIQGSNAWSDWVDVTHGYLIARNTDINNTTPLSSFQIGVTEHNFLNAEMAGKGFPEPSLGGVIETHRYKSNVTQDHAAYQLRHVLGTTRTYKRRWNASTSAWLAWKSVNPRFVSTALAVGNLAANEVKTLYFTLPDYMSDAVVGDSVIVSPASNYTGLDITGHVNTTGSVRINIQNISGAAITDSNPTVFITLIQN